MAEAKTYSDKLLRHLTEQSNLIENEPITGPSFDTHWRATLLCRTAAQEKTLLHPRTYHQLLFEGLPSDPRHTIVPGEYRDVDVYVVQDSGQRHVFPRHHQVLTLMQAWWIKAQEALLFGNPDLRQDSVRWAFHAWFETIHPHQDGNGRTGRLLLWNMDMLARQELTIITFEARHQYYQRLEDWRAKNPDSDWQQGKIRW